LGFGNCFSQVHSMEPNAMHYQMLCNNTKDKSNIKTHNVACGSSTGQVFIEGFDPSQQGNFGKIFTGIGNTHVDCITIDSLDLDECDAIKIDTEGHEYECLLGATNIIQKFNPAILFEYNTGAGDNSIQFLKELDYLVWKFSVRNYNPKNWKNNSQNVYLNSGVTNCIAIPKKNQIESINHAGFVLC
jgi:methyltransferase, FkbM family